MSESENQNNDNTTPEVEQSSSAGEVAMGDTVNETPSTAAEPIEPETAPAAAEVTPVATTQETSSAPTAAAGVSAFAATLKKKWYITAAAVVLVLIVLIGVLFMMEQQGRINTGLFDGVNRMLAMQKSVATVNDKSITQYDLDISISQLSAGAALQGIDIADPEIKSEIQTQAIDMLVNTELLKQEAAARNIVITDEDVQERLTTLTTDVGGEEVLKQRMEEFNIDQSTLLRDIRNELTIQALLEQVFEERGIEVTDTEVEEYYESAGGTAAGLPPLEDVREQIVNQVRTSKEQEVVSGFVQELRGKATVEVLI